MNNIVRIALYIILITLLYLGITTLMRSCGSNDTLGEITDTVENTAEKVNAEEYFEDEFESGETIDLSEDDSFDQGGSRTDYTALDDATDEFESTPNDYAPDKDVVYTPKPTSSTSGSGRHMVIAGNFLQEGNASKMVRKLTNMGYNGAEKVVFDNSQYHSVIATRGNDYARVANVSSELKRNGIDNYIKTQK